MVVTMTADHDIRNPAGLIAVERITRQIMAIPGVRMVQSASRPAGKVPDEATFSGLAGAIGRQLDTTFDSVTTQLGRVADLDAVLASVTTNIRRLSTGLQGSADGLRGMGSAAPMHEYWRLGALGSLSTILVNRRAIL